METDQGKLFIGGISWDTNEERLKEYFGAYGEVVEAVIMRDRTTGRARGFGFVVFADPAVAERVVKEKHMIDGRTVEAKKAVPRDDQHLINRNSGSIQGSPGPGRTKKIFVGGGGFGVFGNNGANWGASPIAPSLGGTSSSYSGGNVGYRGGENSYALGAGGFGRNSGAGVATTSSFSASSGGYEGSYGDFYRSGSVYGDPTWQTASSELDNSGSFGYALGNSEEVTAKDSEDYGVGYDIPNRKSSRGTPF
ncbi:UNVERIFIED_CONTAM: Heterogeneous nuclear ribonucleoprotein 1 [Sesamum radiatum]|uniref:Heterogeneous nuclear ribonucleoprotein 1 n=1 Tax=Sesamum radiatum TaxID=300843 RepID=A0AAW2LR79_SESRA